VEIDVNGTRLWFDVEGPSLVPDGARMRRRPTIVLIHGGPATYDHSTFKPYFGRLARDFQVVYLDLRGHGRSAPVDPAAWSFEVCADDVREFCDALGIVSPIVLGHSMGGFVTILYGARHPGHARALILQSTMARFDLDRMVERFRILGGDHVAGIVGRDFSGEALTEEEWAPAYAAYGPRIPSRWERERVRRHPGIAAAGMERLRAYDVVDQLQAIASPTLVCVGTLDPVTPPAAAQEILDGLPPGIGRLEVLEGAGHFPWLDVPDQYWSVIDSYLASLGGG
jgi:pimeloyl-ACP methyl ester carboxylesterase